MAQIINRIFRAVPASTIEAAVREDLASVLDIDHYGNQGQMYISDKVYTYFQGNSSTIAFRIGHDDLGQYMFQSRNNWMSTSQNSVLHYKIIKSESGDVAFCLNMDEDLTESSYTQCAFLRASDSANNHKYVLYTAMNSNTSSSVAWGLNSNGNSELVLIADDNVLMGPIVTNNGSYTVDNPTYDTTLQAGYNLNNATDKLIPIFNTYTDFITDYARINIVATQPHEGRCLVGSRYYYFLGYLALLDEADES